ncbi:hypothetical protein [Aquibacillus sediminis]|uniref:hypothetical protein n=1 Tax=Aquibacillus sediminis TaxID=2574734 RepID=UPI001109974F|nr:hypothetical protein [Aquibacillus sediminis]
MYIALFFLTYSFVLGFVIVNKMYIKTSSMATVMALGIITQGVISNYFGSNNIEEYTKTLCTINLALWMAFATSYLISCTKRKFTEIHLNNPINRFGIGTWIAGTSICGILVHRQFLELAIVSQILLFINFVFWLMYIGVCFVALRDISRQNLKKEVHGVIFLTTVSTQSIVLLMNTVYNEVPKWVNVSMITMGICFYVIAAYLIMDRYLRNFNSFSIKDDWKNTNCIIHGATSITGLACLFSSSINHQIIIFIWFFTLIIFLSVELIETIRLISRIKSYGVSKGILIYDVSQWSRVFTFGMFYTFTFIVATNINMQNRVQNFIVETGIWVIFILGISELLLSIKVQFENFRLRKLNKPKPIEYESL